MPQQPQVKLNRAHRRILEAAIQQNVEPILNKGKRSTALVTQGAGRGIVERAGTLTDLGRAYFQRKRTRWQPRTTGGPVWSDVQRVYTDRSGMREYVMNQGRKVVVMDWDPVGLKQKVTKAGRQFFANSRMNVEVVVPLIARLRQTGREFETQMSWGEAVDQREEVRVLRSQSAAQRQITLRDQLRAKSVLVQGRYMLRHIADSEVEYFISENRPF